MGDAHNEDSSPLVLPAWSFEGLLGEEDVAVAMAALREADWGECAHARDHNGQPIPKELVACTAIPLRNPLYKHDDGENKHHQQPQENSTNEKLKAVVDRMASMWGHLEMQHPVLAVPAIRYNPGAPGARPHYDAYKQGDTTAPDATIIAYLTDSSDYADQTHHVSAESEEEYNSTDRMLSKKGYDYPAGSLFFPLADAYVQPKPGTVVTFLSDHDLALHGTMGVPKDAKEGRYLLQFRMSFYAPESYMEEAGDSDNDVPVLHKEEEKVFDSDESSSCFAARAAAAASCFAEQDEGDDLSMSCFAARAVAAASCFADTVTDEEDDARETELEVERDSCFAERDSCFAETAKNSCFAEITTRNSCFAETARDSCFAEKAARQSCFAEKDSCFAEVAKDSCFAERDSCFAARSPEVHC